MEYCKKVILKNGDECIIRNGKYDDGAAVLEVFNRTHAQTDFLLTYEDENTFTVERESEYLLSKLSNEREVELIAFVNGKAAGTAGVSAVGNQSKLLHRAEFGIAVDKEYSGLGLGGALTDACAECAEKAGYEQLELSVVAANDRAISLYRKKGFKEFGRHPNAFKLRDSRYYDLILMVKYL